MKTAKGSSNQLGSIVDTWFAKADERLLDPRPMRNWSITTSPRLRYMTGLELACGDGHMDKMLDEYFAQVEASDVHAFGFGRVSDFTTALVEPKSYDWVIINQPFRFAVVFVHQALRAARRRNAVLTRAVIIESIGGYNRLLQDDPSAKFAQFSKRVPMVRGRLDRHDATATD